MNSILRSSHESLTEIDCNEELIVKLLDNLLTNLSQGKSSRVNQLFRYLYSLSSLIIVSDEVTILSLMEASKIVSFRYSSELVMLLKSMGLLNMTTQKYSLPENRVLANIRAVASRFSNSFEESGNEHDMFWICKGNHSTAVLEIIFEVEKQLLTTGSEFSAFFTDKNCADLLFGSLNKSLGAVNQLMNLGIRTVILAVNKSSERWCNDICNIIAEVFNFIIMNFNYPTNTISRLLDDTIAIFNERMDNFRGAKDWVLLYTCIDILLNIARRSTIDVANKIFDLFKDHFYNMSNRSWGLQSMSILENEIMKSTIFLKTRLIESIALISQIPSLGDLTEQCLGFLKECWHDRKRLNLPCQCIDSLHLILFDKHFTSSLTDGLLHLPSWNQLVNRLVLDVFQKNQSILSTFPLPSTTKYYISEIISDELKIAFPNEYNEVTTSSGGNDEYWSHFCLSLLIKYELHVTVNCHPAPPMLPLPQISLVDQKCSVKSDWGYEAIILPIPPPSLQSALIESTPSLHQSSALPPAVPYTDEVVVKSQIFSATDHLESDQPTDDLDIESRITLIRHIISQCERTLKKVADKNIVMVIGATGCGKSTTMNWLLGCTMVVNETTGGIAVQPVREGGAFDEFCAIGDDATVSKTVIPSIFELVDNLYLCDAPGFLESRCPDISIANAVNTLSVITAARSTGFLLLVSYFDLRGAKGSAAKESILALHRMFGSNSNGNNSNDNLQLSTHCITFGVTHATTSQFNQSCTILCNLCNQLNIVISPDKIIHIDQLEEQRGSISRKDLQTMLFDKERINKELAQQFFTNPSLNEKDMTLIVEISYKLRMTCEECWVSQQVPPLIDSFLLLQSLSVIGSHPTVMTEIASLRDFMMNCVQDYINTNILEVIRLPLGDDQRKNIFANMNFLTSLTTLDICFPSNQILTVITDTKSRVLQIERDELSARNIRLMDEMNNMLHVLTVDLDEMLRNKSASLAYLECHNDDNNDLVAQLYDTLPTLAHIMNFKSKLSDEILNRANLFLHANADADADYFRKSVEEMVQLISSTVNDMIVQRILPAKIQNTSNFILLQLNEISDRLNSTMDTLHSTLILLKYQVDCDPEYLTTTSITLEKRLELKIKLLFNTELGLDLTKKSPLLSSFSNLQLLYLKIPSDQGVTEFYHTVLKSIELFWTNLMSRAVTFEKNLFLHSLQSLESAFEEAISQQRTLTTEFDLDFLLGFPSLANHVEVLKRILCLIPNREEENRRMSELLDALKLKLHKTVSKNLSADVMLAVDTFIQNMESNASKEDLLHSLLALQRVDSSLLMEYLRYFTKKLVAVIEVDVCQAMTVALVRYRDSINKIMNRLNRFEEMFLLLGIPLLDEYSQYQLLVTVQLKGYEKAAVDNAATKINDTSESLKQSLRVGLQRFIHLESIPLDSTVQLNNLVEAVDILKKASCLPIDITQAIVQLDSLAQTTEQSLVYIALGTVKLKESVQQLKHDIQEILNEGHASHLVEQSIRKFKSNVKSFIQCLKQSMTTNENAQYLCAVNELTVSYLMEHPDYQRRAKEIQEAARSFPLNIRNPLLLDLYASLTDIRTRAMEIFSNQIFHQITDWMVNDGVGAHVDEIVQKFDILKNICDDAMYASKKQVFLDYCNNMQNKEKIDNLMMLESYTAILSLRILLLNINSKLKHHDFQLDLTPLLDATSNFINNKYHLAIADIECPTTNENFLDFSNLKTFMSVSQEMSSIHQTDKVTQLKDRAQAAFTDFFSPINQLKLLALSAIPRERTDTENTALQHTAKQFVKYFAVATELSMKPDFTANIGVILGEIRGPATDTLSRLIYQLQSERGLSEVCGDILSSFKVFSRVNIEQQNELAKGMTFSQAVERLKSTPPCNKHILRNCRAAYDEVYETCLTAIDRKTYDSGTQLSEMLMLSRSLQEYRFELSRKPEDTAKLLALVCAHFCYIDSQDTYYNFGNKNHLLQMHATQVLAIFLMLGLDTAGPVRGQMNEIPTGEGKSIVLAMIATVYALLEVDIKIVCYSTYLTDKDKNIFTGLFSSLKVSNRITYCTINDLGDILSNDSFPDLRSQVRSFLESKPVSVFQGRPATGVILIDEVDIFFGKDFYGEVACPAIELKSVEAVAFMRYLWTHRAALMAASSSDQATQVVNASASGIIKALCKSYPRLQPLLPSIIKQCLDTLRIYHSEPGKSMLNCFVHNDKVAELDKKSGSIIYYSGVIYTFEYFFQHEKLQPDGSPCISAESLEQNVNITITCGQVLYAELPKLFRVVHGVSGTLAYFQEEQNAILANYGLVRKSFIPTTYTKAPLNIIPTTIYSGDRNDLYFDKIKEVLSDMLLKRRATLVFFKSHELLESFRKELSKRPIQSAAFQAPEILSEHLVDQRRDFVINRAINTGKITLCTKMFMRGTDFICRDSQLRLNGGVHVLLTFYPQSEAEEAQARGRTCRQNDPGSFQMILFAQDLVNKGLLRTRLEGNLMIPDLSETDELVLASENELKRYDIFLDKNRKKKSADSSERIATKLTKNISIHQDTLRMSQLIEQENLEATALLVQFQS